MAAVVSPADRRIRWGRIVAGAFFLELALFAVLIPIGVAFGMPSNATGLPVDATIFFTAVPIGCFVLGCFFGRWVARPLATEFVLHGALLGIAATLIYLGICAIPPSTIPTVVAMYGAPMFVLANSLRIAGGVAGAWFEGSQRARR